MSYVRNTIYTIQKATSLTPVHRYPRAQANGASEFELPGFFQCLWSRLAAISTRHLVSIYFRN